MQLLIEAINGRIRTVTLAIKNNILVILEKSVSLGYFESPS